MQKRKKPRCHNFGLRLWECHKFNDTKKKKGRKRRKMYQTNGHERAIHLLILLFSMHDYKRIQKNFKIYNLIRSDK